MAKALSLNTFKLPANFKLIDPKTWFRVATPIGAFTKLSRRHIYILPTRFGWLFGVLLIALLIGSINYSLSLGFAMTFLLAGFGSISMLHTWRNLANLQMTLRRAEPVFSGEIAIFELTVKEVNNRARYALNAQFKDANLNLESIDANMPDVAALSETIFKLPILSQKRGWLKAPRMVFATDFPVSFFHVWAYAELDGQCLIYPSPLKHSQAIASTDDAGNSGNQHSPQGDDDFAGHRTYQFGDSPKRVDWKASSREQGLLTKQFHGEAVSSVWLDWQATTGENVELRISQLTRWVIDAEANKQRYGLRLPHLKLNPANGEAHYQQCLTALALM